MNFKIQSLPIKQFMINGFYYTNNATHYAILIDVLNAFGIKYRKVHNRGNKFAIEKC